MGWSIGFDSNWNRDIGYGVPAWCDHPDCRRKIDRGLAHVCANQQPYGGEEGCGLYFCPTHGGGFKCEACEKGRTPFEAKVDHPTWLRHKLTHESWQQWRDENPADVERIRAQLLTGKSKYAH